MSYSKVTRCLIIINKKGYLIWVAFFIKVFFVIFICRQQVAQWQLYGQGKPSMLPPNKPWLL
jgi:hypothetical protein